MAKNTPAPKGVTLAQALAPCADPTMNVATILNPCDYVDIPRDPLYNSTTDDGLASLRSKHEVRTRAEIAAARSGDLPLGIGLSLKQPMAGQCENNQFPFRTDRFGKPRN